jgi:SHS2 domain-containing protein
MPSGFTLLEHTADIGFHATGDTPADLFQQAARALLSIAVDTAAVSARTSLAVHVTGDGYPGLLVNFLEEIVYLFDAGRFAPVDCQVERASPTAIHARLIGEPRVPERHPWKLIVKAVTYHGLQVVPDAGGWSARVFLDV